MRRIPTFRSIAAIAILTLASGALLAEKAGSAKPWYAAGLDSLGFGVFEKPRAIDDFSVQALDGTTWRLSQLRGKIVVLNFWATWCPPCRAEMPALDALWKKEKDKPFVIMGVSLGEDLKTVKDFIAKSGYGYPIFLDPDNAVGSEFGIRSIPATYVIDKDGNAIAGKVGGADYDSAQASELFAKLATR